MLSILLERSDALSYFGNNIANTTFDWTYILVLIGAVISIWASSNVNGTFSRCAKYRTSNGITGAQAAETLLRQNGIYDVRVEHIRGNLTDHYDPRSKVLRLSDTVYGSTSVAAVAVAAHECGHAMQHDQGYEPLQLRSLFVPVANIGSKFGIFVVLGGVIFAMQPLVTLGIILFSFGMLFQLITLPVEFNASHRALVALRENGMLVGEENNIAYKVLKAAALTYVAAAAASFLTLLRLIILFGGNGKKKS